MYVMLLIYQAGTLLHHEFRDTCMMGVQPGLLQAPSQSLHGGELPPKD